MTPKEKAIELFDNMAQTISGNCEHDSYCQKPQCKWKGMTLCVAAQNEAKQCAMIAVDEILKGDHLIRTPLSFWKNVREELNKLEK